MSAATIDPILLAQSRDYCARLTRRSAKNFYYGLKLLPEPKRSAMFAIYAYMRLLDDIADEEDGRSLQQRADSLEAWRIQTRLACEGDCPDGQCPQLWPAFSQVVREYAIPRDLFDAAIDGQLQDLQPIAFETFAQLHEYCYRVASVVGLASIHVWGFEGEEQTRKLAIDRGVAFQLTNVLRDLREDLGRGRMYLPRAELREMGVSEEELRSGRDGANFQRFMRFQIERAESYYRSSADLETRIQPDSRATLHAMTQIYHGLLEKISANPAVVLRKRVSLSLWAKLRIAWRAMRGSQTP